MVNEKNIEWVRELTGEKKRKYMEGNTRRVKMWQEKMKEKEKMRGFGKRKKRSGRGGD